MRKTSSKVWEYLVEHKRPVTAEVLADRFMVSKSTVQQALAMFKRSGLIDVRPGLTPAYTLSKGGRDVASRRA